MAREAWVRANVATFAQLMGKIEGDLLGEMLPPGAGIIKSTMAIANRAVATRQFAYLLGFLGQRVLGQYDLALLSAEAEPGRLVFVDENIRRMAAGLGVPLNPFRTWIALHETTHAFEFEAHPWLRPYLADRLERQLKSLSSGVSLMGRAGVDAAGPVAAGRRFGRALDGGAHERGTAARVPRDPGRHEPAGRLRRLHHGRGRAGPGPDVEKISAAFHARREQRGGFERAMMRVTGMDLKMEQYQQGEEFVAAIAKARGAEALQALWLGPETLPLPEEIEMPSLWLARVLPAPGRRRHRPGRHELRAMPGFGTRHAGPDGSDKAGQGRRA